MQGIWIPLITLAVVIDYKVGRVESGARRLACWTDRRCIDFFTVAMAWFLCCALSRIRSPSLSLGCSSFLILCRRHTACVRALFASLGGRWWIPGLSIARFSRMYAHAQRSRRPCKQRWDEKPILGTIRHWWMPKDHPIQIPPLKDATSWISKSHSHHMPYWLTWRSFSFNSWRELAFWPCPSGFCSIKQWCWWLRDRPITPLARISCSEPEPSWPSSVSLDAAAFFARASASSER